MSENTSFVGEFVRKHKTISRAKISLAHCGKRRRQKKQYLTIAICDLEAPALCHYRNSYRSTSAHK